MPKLGNDREPERRGPSLALVGLWLALVAVLLLLAGAALAAGRPPPPGVAGAGARVGSICTGRTIASHNRTPRPDIARRMADQLLPQAEH